MCICQSNLYLLNYVFNYLTISLNRLFIVSQKSLILFSISGKLAFIWSFLFSSSICINYLVMATHMPSNFILNVIYGVLKIMKVKVLVTQSCPTLCDLMDGSPDGLLCPWDSPGKNVGVDCCSPLQGILPTQQSNPGLLHCRQILYSLSHQGSP